MPGERKAIAPEVVKLRICAGSAWMRPNLMDPSLEEWERQKDLCRGISFDMSPAAVARRIHIANGLNRLSRQLSRVGKIAPPTPGESDESVLTRIRQAMSQPAPTRFLEPATDQAPAGASVRPEG